MGASASLSQLALAVDPGQLATCDIKVRNTGQIVDEFTIDVVGVADEWATVEPPVLRLFPGAEDTAKITFKPPRLPSVPAGTHPFGVRVISKEDGPGSAVEEGVIDIGRFVDVGTELIPKTSRGRRKAVHDLAVDNRGNSRLEGEVNVVDPDGLLRYEVVPPVVSSEPGTATFLKVRVKPKDTFLRGAPKTIPFQTVLTAEGAEPAYADGSMLQEQILPSWLVPALMALVALIIAFVVLWFTLLKPTVESAAQAVVNDQLDETQAAAEEAQAAAEDAQATASSVAAAVDAGGGGGGGGGGGTETTTTVAGGGGGTGTTATTTPALPGVLALGPETDFRLAPSGTGVSNGSSATVTRTTEAGKTLLITDIVFQNPNSDTGTITLRRDGTVLIEVGLANFRDLDYHFIAPLQFKEGQKIEFVITCDTAGSAGKCTPAAYFAGVLATPTA